MCALARVARESIGVEKKKEFPDQRRSARRTFPHLGSPRSRPTLPLLFFRDRTRTGRSNDRGTLGDVQAYTDDEQKLWFDKNDYRWLRERGVCTRPALGIYIETNPISHYVLPLSLPVNSQFMLVISRCIYILLNPRKKRPVTQKFFIIINDQ